MPDTAATGSWGAEADVYIMFFDLDAYERFRMNKEELALIDESKKKEDDKEKKDEKTGKKKDDKKDTKKDEKKEEVKPLVFDSKTVETELSA